MVLSWRWPGSLSLLRLRQGGHRLEYLGTVSALCYSGSPLPQQELTQVGLGLGLEKAMLVGDAGQVRGLGMDTWVRVLVL